MKSSFTSAASMHAKKILLLALFTTSTISATPALATTTALVERYQELQLPRVSDGSRYSVDTTIALDVFTVHLKGTLAPLLQSDEESASPRGWYFSGSGSHTVKPITDGEWRSLAFRSGQNEFSELTTDFSQAVLWADDMKVQHLLSGASTSDDSLDSQSIDSRLQELVENTFQSQVSGLPLDVLAAERNDTEFVAATNYLYLLTNAARPGATLLGYDVRGILDGEESMLYVFANEVDEGEAKTQRNDEDQNSEEGDEDPASDPGFWYSSRTVEAVRAGSPYGEGDEPLIDVETVSIDSTISRDVDLRGETKTVATVLVPGLRVLPFDLEPTLRIREVTAHKIANDDTRQALPVSFVQQTEEQGGSAALLFDSAPTLGDRIELNFSYSGDGVLEDDGVRTYRVRARASWYPNFDDLARFDLTFTVPKGHTVIAVGEPTSNRTVDGNTVSSWSTKVPIRVAGFNYGGFKRYHVKEENTGYDIEVFASLGVPDIITEINGALRQQSAVMTPDQAVAVAGSGVTIISQYAGATDLGVSMHGLAESAMADAQNSVQVFTAKFGPSPFDRLAITQQAEWTFGQAWPGLIYLPYAASFSRQARSMLGLSGMANFIDEVGIHEIAHQWWGHLIGWKSYRDQWISEGFAEFSAALVIEATQGQEAYDQFWRQRRVNVLGSRFGKPPAWTGSVMMGFRASSARSPLAYQGLAYGKGGYILHMLRNLMRNPQASDPDAAFFNMLRDFAQTFAGKEVTTADFHKTVQKHFVPSLNARGDGKVDWFFDQWVYGRSIPTIASDLKWESAGRGKYRILGTVTQSNVRDDFVTLVPFYADLGKDTIGMFGRTALRGEMTREIDTVVSLPRKPRELLINHRNEVLAYDK